MMHKENLQIEWMVSTVYIQYTLILIYFTKVIQSRTVSDFISDVWFTLFDTNGNSSYIRLLKRNNSPKNENAVVVLNLYEIHSAVEYKIIYLEQYW